MKIQLLHLASYNTSQIIDVLAGQSTRYSRRGYVLAVIDSDEKTTHNPKFVLIRY